MVGAKVDAPIPRSAVRVVYAHPLAVGLREAAFAGDEGLALVVGAERAVALEGLEVGGEHVTVVGDRDLGVAAPVLAVRLRGAADQVPLNALVVGLPEPGSLRGASSRAARVDPALVVDHDVGLADHAHGVVQVRVVEGDAVGGGREGWRRRWRGDRLDRQRARVVLRRGAAQETAGDDLVRARLEVRPAHRLARLPRIARTDHASVGVDDGQDFVVGRIGPRDVEREISLDRVVGACRDVHGHRMLVGQRGVIDERRAVARRIRTRRDRSRPGVRDGLARAGRHGHATGGRGRCMRSARASEADQQPNGKQEVENPPPFKL